MTSTTPWAGSIETLTLVTDDLIGSRSFYERVFDLVPIFANEDSAVYRIGGLQIGVLEALAFPEVIAPFPMAAPGAGTRALLTIPVPDVDARVADLIDRGVTILNGPVDQPWGVRTACFADPGGHVWEIAQPIPQPDPAPDALA